MIQFFDYGFLNQQNIPSEINLEKRSIGQNARQSLCLFQNIPFILYSYRENVKICEIWHCFESLLRIVEIVYSHEITDNDLNMLDHMIHLHLKGITDLGHNLIPKHHFMLHYAPIIRSLGPLVHMNMSRFESKHKVFKDFAKNTHNFMNINKSLAIKHQTLICTNGFTYIDNIKSGMLVSLDSNFIAQNEQVLNENVRDLSKLSEIKWLRINSYEYRKDLFIVHQKFFYRIRKILIDDNCHFLFCQRFNAVTFVSFLNSFRIEEDVSFILIELSKLKNARTYEMKTIEKDQYVICESLALRNNLSFPH